MKRRDEAAPWSEEIRKNPSGLPGVIGARFGKKGKLTFEEVMAGSHAGRRCVRRLFDQIVASGRAVLTEEGIEKCPAPT